MNIPEIAKCPGCRAKVEVANDVKSHPGDNLRVQVCCFLCDYRGPSRYLVEDAIYAHNAICRQPTPEAAGCPRCKRLHKAYKVANEHLSVALEVISKQLAEDSE